MKIRSVLDRRLAGLSLRSQLSFRLGRLDRPPLYCGVRLSAPDSVASWSIAHQIADGEYNLDGYVPRHGDRVVDVGANIGVFALWAARRGARVVSYEPAPETFSCLARNVNGHAVRAVRAAVVGSGYGRSTVSLFLHPERSTRNSVFAREIESGVELTDAVEVPAVPLEEVLRDGCDLLKVDCEGAEFEMFDQTSDQALRKASRILLEFHRSAGQPSTLITRLQEAGFECSYLSGEDGRCSFGVIAAERR